MISGGSLFRRFPPPPSSHSLASTHSHNADAGNCHKHHHQHGQSRHDNEPYSTVSFTRHWIIHESRHLRACFTVYRQYSKQILLRSTRVQAAVVCTILCKRMCVMKSHDCVMYYCHHGFQPINKVAYILVLCHYTSMSSFRWHHHNIMQLRWHLGKPSVCHHKANAVQRTSFTESPDKPNKLWI